jgi:hypothetical protein
MLDPVYCTVYHPRRGISDRFNSVQAGKTETDQLAVVREQRHDDRNPTHLYMVLLAIRSGVSAMYVALDHHKYVRIRSTFARESTATQLVEGVVYEPLRSCSSIFSLVHCVFRGIDRRIRSVFEPRGGIIGGVCRGTRISICVHYRGPGNDTGRCSSHQAGLNSGRGRRERPCTWIRPGCCDGKGEKLRDKVNELKTPPKPIRCQSYSVEAPESCR